MKYHLPIALLYACCSLLFVACGDDDGDTDPDPMDPMNPSVQLPASIAGTMVNMEFTTANPGAPYQLNDQVLFTFGNSGSMAIDEDPGAANGDELTVNTFTIVGSEYVWEDANGGHRYALSLLPDSSINEVNVSSTGGSFLGQFTPIDTSGPDLTSITDFAGTYNVAQVDHGTHDRMTVIINANGSIDFDTGKLAAPDSIVDINDVVLIDNTREVRVTYSPFPTEPYLTVIMEADANGTLTAIEYQVDIPGPGLDRNKVQLQP
ncbi:MAG: hypothetical protein AAGB22_03990 [Bacteroidota bacterium]